MSQFQVSLTSIEDVKRFSRAADRLECEIDVTAGRYTVNAKSIMGLFSMDLAHPVTVEVHGDDAQMRSFQTGIQSLLTKE